MGVDTAHVAGDFTFLDVPQAAYWSVGLDRIRLGDILSISASKLAIIDSGTTLLAGPKNEVEAITAMLGAEYFAGLYVVDCAKKLPTLTFVLGGHEFTVAPEELVVDRQMGFCILGLQPLNSNGREPMWILGELFMRKYYVQFDFGRRRVGLALAKTASDNLV